MTSVRAARLFAHDVPLKIGDVALEEPGDDEVEAKMGFGGVNPVDRYMAIGRVAPDAQLPRTIGLEGVGRLDGCSVVLHGFGFATSRDGLWSERAVVPRAAAVPVPEGVGPAEAAAVGVAGATAYRTVHDLARVRPDDRVLVLGACGGVGSMIVSLLRRVVAAVWGQTGREWKASFVADQGAERVVVVADPAALPETVADLRPTVVFDPLGGGFTGAAIEALEPGGRLVLFGTSADTHGHVPLQALYRKNLQVLGYGGLMEKAEARGRATQGALEVVRHGSLSVHVDSVMPLDTVNEAFGRIVERSVSAKLVLPLSH